MEEDFARNVIAGTLKETDNNGDSEGRPDFPGRDVPGDAELNMEPVLKEKPSPGDDHDHRRVIVIHRLRFPRFLRRRRFPGILFKKV